MNTKDKIIYESLKLFSINGFDSVSTRDITKALGLSDSSIYKHFKSKREILDEIVSICKEKFILQVKTIDLENMHWDDLENLCLSMFNFQTKNEWIVMFRRLLIIEQYKDEKMYKMYRDFFINLEVDNTAKILKELINEGYLVDLDPYALAMELYSPFFMYHMSVENDDELLSHLMNHVRYFKKNYCIVGKE